MRAVRTAAAADLQAVTTLEALCFPAAEAATEEDFRKRLAVYPNHFWLLEDDDGTLISFINGLCTDEDTLRDEMYEDASLHREDGAWQMIFGVNTHPDWRQQGCAAAVMTQVIAEAKAEGRRGCVLTCKDRLVHYYEKFGYRDLGLSASTHGGVVWHDMRLEF